MRPSRLNASLYLSMDKHTRITFFSTDLFDAFHGPAFGDKSNGFQGIHNPV